MRTMPPKECERQGKRRDAGCCAGRDLCCGPRRGPRDDEDDEDFDGEDLDDDEDFEDEEVWEDDEDDAF